jgi:hypothetical protein
MAGTNKKTSLPSELQDIVTPERLTTMEDRLGKAYSSERYEEFQAAVEKIIHKELTTDEVHKKLNPHIDARVQKYIQERGWKNKNFWIPTIGVLLTAIATAALYFKK